jgi:hypothetical protein
VLIEWGLPRDGAGSRGKGTSTSGTGYLQKNRQRLSNFHSSVLHIAPVYHPFSTDASKQGSKIQIFESARDAGRVAHCVFVVTFHLWLH